MRGPRGRALPTLAVLLSCLCLVLNPRVARTQETAPPADPQAETAAAVEAAVVRGDMATALRMVEEVSTRAEAAGDLPTLIHCEKERSYVFGLLDDYPRAERSLQGCERDWRGTRCHRLPASRAIRLPTSWNPISTARTRS